MSQGPDVVLVAPDPPQSAREFWDVSCRPLGPDRLQFVGLDADAWLQQKPLCEMTTWVKDFRTILATQSPERLFVTTIIMLAWPQDRAKASFEDLDRFRHLLLAGAHLRLKRGPNYQRAGQVGLDDFRKDLEDAGLLMPADSRQGPPKRAAPSFGSQEEEEDYKAREQFYADPPFKWGPADVATLFGKKAPLP